MTHICKVTHNKPPSRVSIVANRVGVDFPYP